MQIKQEREIDFETQFPLLSRGARDLGGDPLGLIPSPATIREDLGLKIQIGNQTMDCFGTLALRKTLEQPNDIPRVMPVGFSPKINEWVYRFEFEMRVPRGIRSTKFQDRYRMFVEYTMLTPEGELRSVFYADGFPLRLSARELYRPVEFDPFIMAHSEAGQTLAGILYLPDDLDGLINRAHGRLVILS